jgi:hypothetical protein
VKSARRLPVLTGIIAIATVAMLVWLFLNTPAEIPRQPTGESLAPVSQPASPPRTPTAAERLLEGYADPSTPPIEDLKKIHRVATGYFTVAKDSSHFPIGGNADLAAALRGENPNRETYVSADHPVFSQDGLLVDRWGSPLVVHPEAWTQLELRSAGPDKIAYTPDDLILKPSGEQAK